ncbi:MAG: ATP-grasp domain-containing protein [Phycisphaerales bacterium]|nr:ATP-grasp domain-containing protein [Phycisphaerales bacterium]
MGSGLKGAHTRLIVHSLEASRMGDGLEDGLGAEVLRMLSHRAVLLSEPGDVVVVDSEVDEGWLDSLGSIDLEVGRVVVARGEGETVGARLLSDDGLMDELSGGEWVVEPYMGGEEMERVADRLGAELWAPGVELLDRLNLKSNLCPILGHTGLATIPTTVAGRGDVLSTARHMLNEFGCVMVRSDLSIGGHGVWRVESEDDLRFLQTGVERASAGRLFVLQPLLEVTHSPNVQFAIRDDGPELLGVSAQQMTESFAFGGNSYPSEVADDPKVLDQSVRIAEWMRGQGHRGMVGIDVIVTVDGGVFIVEINPRVNTSTFPLLLSERLGCGAFRLVTGLVWDGFEDGMGFEELMGVFGGEVVFDRVRGNGVVPLMLPRAGRRVLDVMVFGDDLNEVGRIERLMMERLGSGMSIGGVE